MSTAIAARTRPTSRALPILLNVVIATMTAGCEAIGTIFKAGVWTGVIAVVVVIGLVAFVAMKVGR
ncbi:MAG TPA: hypothetical protein VFB92_04185 [Vicinamibacterales bacterium]|jgi:hypothetical protein|nr:hypothetical protein [Vicinamibacterales bacterium]